MSPLQKIVIILGPTACGKTALSLRVAQIFQGEIISGDSMQVYRRMDIGTAKIKTEAQQGIAHHLLDIREPDEPFSVADFRRLAMGAIQDIASRGKLPIIVGGTGLYLNSLLYAYHFPMQADVDPAIRLRLEKELAERGNPAMHQHLTAIDPVAAKRIHINDAHRIIRALEVYEGSGIPISEIQAASLPPPAYNPILIGLKMDRLRLYQRIEERVDQMLEDGLVAEVKTLLNAGVSRDTVSMQGLGYRQMSMYLLDDLPFADAVTLLKRDTRRFAKRQMTWFRRNEKIVWFDIDHYREEDALSHDVCALIARRMKEESHEGSGTTGENA